MATSKKSDYFGLSYIVSIILAIIPFTSWLCGIVTRLSEGKIVAALIRIFFGFNIIWICDLVLMILSKHILRLLNI
jgi:hypothetical protein